MAHLGILSLDTAFPRIAGDAGNPMSYPFSARMHVVERADASVIVSDNPPPQEMLDAFIRAAKQLEFEGAAALVSTCGFLVHAQAEIARAVRIPVMLSSLSMYPMVQMVCPGSVGILTASARALGPNALAAPGVDDAEIAGMDHHALFRDTFLATKAEQRREFDRDQMEALVLHEAEALIDRAPLSALILECGNLCPYAPALRNRFGLPVFSILDAAGWMMQSQLAI
jgi:Asp/Glu/hydantoin racemase